MLRETHRHNVDSVHSVSYTHLNSLRDQNEMKSDGAKCGVWEGWGGISQPNFGKYYTMIVQCSYKKNTENWAISIPKDRW